MLEAKFTTSIFWMSLNSILKLILMIFSFYLLSRIIDPEDFGKAALFVGFAGLITTTIRGVITQYIITKTNKNRAEINLLLCWAYKFFLKCRISVILILSLITFISFYFSILSPVIILQIWILSELLSVSYKSICEGNFQFKHLVLLENGAYILGYLLVVAVSAVKFDLGFLSILLGLLGESLVLLLGYYYLSKPYKHGDTKGNQNEFKFALKGMIQIRSLNYILSNVDYWFVGLAISHRALGLYERSFKLINLPCNIIFNIIERVFLPYISETRADNSTNYNKYGWVIFFVSSLLFSSYYLLSDSIFSLVRIILPQSGEWDEVLNIVLILSFLVPAKIILKFMDTYLRAHSELHLLAKLKIVTLVSIFISLILADSLYQISLSISLAYNLCAFFYIILVASLKHYLVRSLVFLIPFLIYILLNYESFFRIN
jgi:O-antigen/teichoic acid export membrane protein